MTTVATAGAVFADDSELVVDHPRPTRLDRFTLLALSTAQRAVSQATARRTADIGVFVATRLGCFAANRDHAQRLLAGAAPSPLVFPATVPSAAASELAIYYRATGPNITLTGEPSVVEQVLLLAFAALADGECQAALVVAVDAWDEALERLDLTAAEVDGACAVYLSSPPSPAVESQLWTTPLANEQSVARRLWRWASGTVG